MVRFSFLFLGLLLPFYSLVGQEIKLPRIVDYSKNSLSTKEGHILSLSVNAEGASVSYRWVRRSGRQLCSTSSCEINTSGWGAGDHKIYAIAHNSVGEAIVTYHIKILPRSFDLNPEKKIPQQETSSKQVRYFSYEKQSMRALKGEGFLFGLSEVQTIDARKQLLPWNKRMVLPLSALVLFGKEKVQEFITTGGSLLQLINYGRTKIVVLENGVLRLRVYEKSSLNPIIKIGENIQIQPSTPSDFLVSLNKEKNTQQKKIEITIIKGTISFSYYEDLEENSNSEKIVFKKIIQQGSSLRGLVGERESFRVYPLASTNFEELFYTTTPYYEANFEDPLKSKEEYGRTKRKIPIDLDSALKSANNLIDKKDYLAALEQLLPYNEKIYDSYLLAYLLGKASRKVFLFEQARIALEIAQDIDEDRMEAKQELAQLNFMMEAWEKSEAFFDQTTAESSENEKLWYYYRGVNNYNLAFLSSAKWYFKYSLWEKSNDDIDSSIKGFFLKIDEKKSLDGLLNISYIRDNNPLNIAQGMKNQDGTGVSWTDGATVNLDLSYKIFKNGFNSGSLSWKSYLLAHPDFMQGNFVEQTVSLPAKFSVIQSSQQKREKPDLFLGIEPILGVQLISDLRSYDKVGMKWSVGSYRLGLNLNMSYLNSMNIDPDPDTLKPIDPVNWEDNQNLDLGYRQRAIILNASEKKENYNYLITLMISENLYRFVESSGKSFSSFLGAVEGVYAFTLRWSVLGFLKYDRRSFNNSGEKRRDSLMSFGTSIIWSWLPNINLYLSVNSESRQSSVSKHSYQKWLYKSGLGYSL